MRCVLLLLCLASGCASYTQAKIDLTTQIRRGVESTRRATVARQQLIERLGQAQFDRLDAAFDLDVERRRKLDARWVIDHRKAYALARDVLRDQEHSLRHEQETIESNLDLIDKALRQLQLMHEIESRLSLPEGMR